MLVEEHVAVEGGELRAVRAAGHGFVHQAEGGGAARAEEFLGAVERAQELQFRLAVENEVDVEDVVREITSRYVSVG